MRRGAVAAPMILVLFNALEILDKMGVLLGCLLARMLWCRGHWGCCREGKGVVREPRADEARGCLPSMRACLCVFPGGVLP